MAKRLDIKDLNIYYSKFHAVKDVTLSVPPRSITAFIGPSGCGKSTVLRTLNRMHEEIPGAYAVGSVLLDGEDIYAKGINPTAVRTTIGMVFQRPNPFPTMSIYDNVIAGMKLNNKKASKSEFDDTVERSLRGANLWNEVKDRLGESGTALSGGQQQRIALPQRHVEMVGKAQNHFAARYRPSGFEKAQVPLRDFCLARQPELAEAAALPPLAQQIADRIGRGVHTPDNNP